VEGGAVEKKIYKKPGVLPRTLAKSSGSFIAKARVGGLHTTTNQEKKRRSRRPEASDRGQINAKKPPILGLFRVQLSGRGKKGAQGELFAIKLPAPTDNPLRPENTRQVDRAKGRGGQYISFPTQARSLCARRAPRKGKAHAVIEEGESPYSNPKELPVRLRTTPSREGEFRK